MDERPGDRDPAEPVTPVWRGRLHAVAFFVAVPAGLAPVLIARTTSARVAATIYALSLAGLYGASAAYHRRSWSPRTRSWLKRLDHSMIFVLIAGTVIPVSLLVLRKPWSVVLLVVVWGGAGLGIALKILRVDGFRVLTSAPYIALGWAVVLLAPQFVRALSAVDISLVMAGGLIYTIGAIILLRRKPDPAPATFGYHEVWHSMVIAGSACHYAVFLLLLLPFRQAAG